MAKAAMDSGVARIDIDLDAYVERLELRRGKGQQIRNQIVNKAKRGPRTRIVYGEGENAKLSVRQRLSPMKASPNRS